MVNSSILVFTWVSRSCGHKSGGTSKSIIKLEVQERKVSWCSVHIWAPLWIPELCLSHHKDKQLFAILTDWPSYLAQCKWRCMGNWTENGNKNMLWPWDRKGHKHMLAARQKQLSNQAVNLTVVAHAIYFFQNFPFRGDTLTQYKLCRSLLLLYHTLYVFPFRSVFVICH